MFLKIYLAAYFAVVGVALVALWQGRVLGRLPAEWVALVVVAAVILGILLALVSRKRPVKPT
jgi:hypothetical protein